MDHGGREAKTKQEKREAMKSGSLTSSPRRLTVNQIPRRGSNNSKMADGEVELWW